MACSVDGDDDDYAAYGTTQWHTASPPPAVSFNDLQRADARARAAAPPASAAPSHAAAKPSAVGPELLWDCSAAPAAARGAEAPSAAARRSAAQPAWHQRGAVAAPAAPAQPAARPAAAQYATNVRVVRAAPQAAAPALAGPAAPDESEPELLRKSPAFRAWCVEQMDKFSGNMAVVAELLRLDTPGAMNELCQAMLKGNGIGLFVNEFWSRRDEAAKGGKGGSKKKKAGGAAKASAPTAQVRAPPAPAPVEPGWQAAANGKAKSRGGNGGKAAGGSGGAGGKGKGGVASANALAGGFALLPSV